MVVLVTFEGVRTQTKSMLYSQVRRLLAAAKKDCAQLDVASDCPYTRSLRLFGALRSASAAVALCPASFYAHSARCDEATWLESVNALREALAPGVTLHVMFSIMCDEHGTFEELMTKTGAGLEDVAAVNDAILATAKNPAGHPWPVKSIVIPAPRYALDTPHFLDGIAHDIVSIIARSAPPLPST